MVWIREFPALLDYSISLVHRMGIDPVVTAESVSGENVGEYMLTY